MAVLKVLIGRDAYIVETRWLEVGWCLWLSMAEYTCTLKRDFFLPLPIEGLSLHQRRMASYAAASSMSQSLFAALSYEDEGD